MNRSLTDIDQIIWLTNESYRSLTVSGETTIRKVINNRYRQPEQHRGPYSIWFHSHCSDHATVAPGGRFSIHLARQYLANIQNDRHEIALVCADPITKSSAAYLNDQSGFFELEIRLWSTANWISNFFQFPRYSFLTVVTM